MGNIGQENSNFNWKNIRYSSIFSRNNFNRLLRYNDYTLFQEIIRDYDSKLVGKKLLTYTDFTNYAYKYMLKNYRNEYIFKNSLINMLIKKYKTQQTVLFNEFAVGNSIADLVMFNGISRAYEIKTELDSDKRLITQLADYKKIFQQCFIVIHESCIEKYDNLDNDIGIIVLSTNRGHIKFETIKEPINNDYIDSYALMRCLRTSEYKGIIKQYYGSLPIMDAFSAFSICEKMMAAIPSSELNTLFIQMMKKRKTNINHLKEYNTYLRQICLSMHLTTKEYEIIKQKLNNPISL